MQDDLFGALPSPPVPAPALASEPAAAAGGATARPAAQRMAKPSTVQAAAVPDALHTLAAQLPAQLHLGVSTWSYPGWDGLVWDGVYDPSVLSRKGLAALAQHPLMRTVSIDRTFWRPLTTEQYAQYAAQLPQGFRCMVKCPNVITDALVRGEKGEAQAPNPVFLEPTLAVDQFVRPTMAGLGAHLGVLVFQLSPLPWDWLRQPGALWARLGALLAAVRTAIDTVVDEAVDPAGAAAPTANGAAMTAAHRPIVAVEVRDPDLLTPALVEVLRAHGATYCLGLHGKMPPIAEQLPLLRALWPGPLVCRWSLNRAFGPFGYPQAQTTHAPFDTLRSPDPATRAALARTIAGVTGAGQQAYVSVSNDAEGCAPRSIALLAQAVQERAAPPQP